MPGCSQGNNVSMNRRITGCGAVFATLMPKAAQADIFGTYTGGAGPHADSALHTYCFDSSLNSAREGAVHGAMDYLQNYTDMSSAFATSCGSAVDVNFQEANLAGSIRGDYVCLTLDPNDSTRCMASRVRLDIAQLQTNTFYANNLAKTIRHEVGHSVGLRHSDSDEHAMVNGEVDDSVNWLHYSDHHKDDHINDYY